MKFYYTLCLLIGAFLFGCMNEPVVGLDAKLEKSLLQVSRSGQLDYFVFPSSEDYSNLPNQDPKNPITAEKVKLGNLLFFETGIAQDPLKSDGLETYSCSSCHIPSAGFTPGRIQGIADGAIGFGRGRQVSTSYRGEEVDAQGVRPLSVLHSAYSTNALWSGTFGSTGVNVGTEAYWDNDPSFEINHEHLEGLEAQNIEGLKTHRMEVTQKMLRDYGYKELFDEAFPEFDITERYSQTTTSFALAAFLRTIYAQEAPFQKWLKGDQTAMTESQKLGALLFFGKANCSSCHNGPALSNMTFHALGTKDLAEHADAVNTDLQDPRNLGRAFLTGEESDYYKFKVPQLYNLKNYSHYFHGSSKTTLEEVLDFKIKAQTENPNVDQSRISGFFNPISLTENEKAALLDFLSEGLHDPYLTRYQPEELPSGNCFPNNDLASRAILGCD